MARVDPTPVLDEVMTLQQALAQTIAPRRLTLILLVTFAVSTLVIALGGVGAGLVGAVALTRVMASLLYQVAPRDPLTFVVVAAALAVTAVLACFVPAMRAARVGPAVALRCGESHQRHAAAVHRGR